MFNSVSLNVQNAWENREALGIDQSEQTVEELFTAPTTPSQSSSVDITGLNKADVQKEIAQTQAEIETLTAEKAENDKSIKALQAEMETLKKQINETITKAVRDSKQFTDQQQVKIVAASMEIVAEYIASNGKMTQDDMKKRLSAKLGTISTNIPAEILASLSSAEGLMSQLNANAQLLSNLCLANQNITNQITCKQNRLVTLNEQLAALDKAEEERKCDPIGFVVDGKICDFIIDRNNDGKFNNEGEFLGAQNNWFEMISLDQNGNNDGKVSREEMENANVKVLVTNEDGSQQIVSIAELGLDEVDLSSYQNSGQSIGNNNTLLGTFGLTINGQSSYDGYNTLDTISWLDENYSNMFTDKAEKIGRFATEDGLPEDSQLSYNISENMFEVLNMRNAIDTAKAQIDTYFVLVRMNKNLAMNLLPNSIEPDEEDDRPRKIA